MRLKKVIETCLYSRDLDRAKAFYVDLLGVDIYGEEKGRHIFLKMPDGGMVLLFNPDETSKEGQDLPSHFASGHQHLAFEVEKTEYPDWKARVQRASTMVLHEHTWKNDVKSFYFRDPDGNLLEICEPGMWA